MSEVKRSALLPVEQALKRLLNLAEAAPIRDTERVALAAAHGRVLA
ncbi:MAG: molybdopterin molybdenumtransferase MoeA, partial [Pseudomonas sp.]